MSVKKEKGNDISFAKNDLKFKNNNSRQKKTVVFGGPKTLCELNNQCREGEDKKIEKTIFQNQFQELEEQKKTRLFDKKKVNNSAKFGVHGLEGISRQDFKVGETRLNQDKKSQKIQFKNSKENYVIDEEEKNEENGMNNGRD